MRTLSISILFLALAGCSRQTQLPPSIHEAALIKTTHITTGQEANLSGLQRSIYFSVKANRYYCVDFIAKTTLQDLIFVSVYDEATASFRPVEGAQLIGLTLHIEGESLKPVKRYMLLSVEQPPQLKDSKP